MPLLLKPNIKILGQGITGSEGQRALAPMLKYGTPIAAGVTPGKGGQSVQGIPIFNSVKEALSAIPDITVSVQFVPPHLTKSATIEAIEAGIKFILIGAEKVPTQDAAFIHALSTEHKVSLVGPSSVGLISPKYHIKLGSIGGDNPDRVYTPGNIAIISKSGGMTSEIGLHLKNNNLGISYAVGIGGDIITGSDFADWLIELDQDPDTYASVIFGELGGTYEEKVAEAINQGKIKKPIVAFISGEFTLSLPTSVQFGHAGAMIEGNRGRPDYKRKILQEAGVLVAKDFDQISSLIRSVI